MQELAITPEGRTALFAAVDMFIGAKGTVVQDAAEVAIDDAVANVLGEGVEIVRIDAEWGKLDTVIVTSLGMISVSLVDETIGWDDGSDDYRTHEEDREDYARAYQG